MRNPDKHRRDIDDYLTYLESRGRSPYTVRSYRLGLEHFHRWLESHNLSLPDVSKQVLEAYLDDLRISPKDGAVRPSLERAGQVNATTRKAYPIPERKALDNQPSPQRASGFLRFPDPAR